MAFCDHCEGQRFDRARVLRALREAQRRLGRSGRSRQMNQALTLAIQAVRALDIPHLEPVDDVVDGEVVH